MSQTYTHMKRDHREWIAQYVARLDGRLLGRCVEACREMRAAFPELVEVRGHVHDRLWGKRGHVWLVDPAGQVVDPTRAQFPDVLAYAPWKPGDEVRVGKCHNCGEELWSPVNTLAEEPKRRDFCGEQCHSAFMRSL